MRYGNGGYSANISFINNLFENNSDTGLQTSGDQFNPHFSNISFLSNNFIDNGGYGLYNSFPNSSIIGNSFTNNIEENIYLFRSADNTIKDNTFIGFGLYMTGINLGHYTQYTLNNLVNGKPLLFLYNKDNLDFSTELGQVIIINSSFISISDFSLYYTGFAPIYIRESTNVTVNNMILDGSGENGIFVEYSENITISNTNVKNKINGIDARNSDGLSIFSNEIYYNTQGINFVQNNNIFLSSNTIYSNTGNGLKASSNINISVVENIVYNNSLDGLEVKFGNNVFLIGNLVYNNTFNGIGIGSGGNMDLISNTVYDNTMGINITGQSSVTTVDQNIIFNNSFSGIGLINSLNSVITNNALTNDGIYLSASAVNYYNSHSIIDNTVNNKSLLFINNEFNKSYSTVAGQIIIVESSLIDIKNHSISNVEQGLLIYYSNSITVWNNTFQSNDRYAVTIDQNSYGNVVYRNDFVNNGIYYDQHQARDDGTNNAFVSNYWNDWSVGHYDYDQDGFLDMFYPNIFGSANNIDLFPLGQSVFVIVEPITIVSTSVETTTETNQITATVGETITKTTTTFGFSFVILLIGVVGLVIGRKKTKEK